MKRAVSDRREDDFVYYVSGLPNCPPDFRLETSVKGGDTVDAVKNRVAEWALRILEFSCTAAVSDFSCMDVTFSTTLRSTRCLRVGI